MDPQNLKTASHYVNNLLLSRGLLRNGVPIEFAKPSKGEGGSEATKAKIINLVHDMVLRRDRESEALNSVSQTMTAMRTAAAQQAQAIARLETKNADLQRQVALSVVQERTATSSLKGADIRNKALREDLARLKTTVGQIRAQCANDVRKRDVEMQRLKKYLEVRRGREAGAQVGLTVVTPGVTKPRDAARVPSSSSDLESRSYSLKEETTEFLTQLSQSLSNENDALISLVQMTLGTLRGLQGLPERHLLHDSNGDEVDDPNASLNIPPSYETLAVDMDDVVEHLRSLLTNPSFVPLEEVEVREEEILRLREGWEKMESRWREAITLMNSWRKRMMETGDTINLEDLRNGFGNLGAEDLLKSRGARKSSASELDVSDESLVSDHSLSHDESKLEEQLAANTTSPLKPTKSASIFPAPSILQSTSGNSRRSPSPRKTSFQQNSAKSGALDGAFSDEDDIALLDDLAGLEKPSPSRKRQRQTEYDPEESDLTVQQKLEKAEREAEKAAEARRLAEATKRPVKRTAIPKKIRSKRRSTLSPAELESLMGIS